MTPEAKERFEDLIKNWLERVTVYGNNGRLLAGYGKGKHVGLHDATKRCSDELSGLLRAMTPEAKPGPSAKDLEVMTDQKNKEPRSAVVVFDDGSDDGFDESPEDPLDLAERLDALCDEIYDETHTIPDTLDLIDDAACAIRSMAKELAKAAENSDHDLDALGSYEDPGDHAEQKPDAQKPYGWTLELNGEVVTITKDPERAGRWRNAGHETIELFRAPLPHSQSLFLAMSHPNFGSVNMSFEDKDIESSKYWWVTDHLGREYDADTLEEACNTFLAVQEASP